MSFEAFVSLVSLLFPVSALMFFLMGSVLLSLAFLIGIPFLSGIVWADLCSETGQQGGGNHDFSLLAFCPACSQSGFPLS